MISTLTLHSKQSTTNPIQVARCGSTIMALATLKFLNMAVLVRTVPRSLVFQPSISRASLHTFSNAPKIKTNIIRASINRRHGFAIRAAHVSDSGSIDVPLMQSMEKKIKEQLNAAAVAVKDVSGDGRHVCIEVISSAFEGQSQVNRQRMVYKAIWEELQNTVHAVDQMITKTPSEAS